MEEILPPLSPPNTRHPKSMFPSLGLAGGPQLSAGPWFFLTLSWLMAAGTLFSLSTSSPAGTWPSPQGGGKLGSGPGVRLNDCQKQGTRTLSEHELLEGEAVHCSWGRGREDVE